MKFLPDFFKTEAGITKFCNFLRAFVDLEVPHIQFNVVSKENLLDAQKHPDQYRSLTVRVAGYTAYFTELAGDLQNEISRGMGFDIKRFATHDGNGIRTTGFVEGCP